MGPVGQGGRLHFTVWYIIVGALLVTMGLAGSVLSRLPLTASLLYLAAGVVLGPFAVGLIRVDPIESSAVIERVTEFAVLVSLFAAGLKMRVPLADRQWWRPVRLAFLSMTVTVGLVAAVGVWLLDLPLGAAILLGAILAPTDPVLASDVQVEHPTDRDRLRFGLTGEAGLNDGTAFPFVMLGLGLLGLHDIGTGGWKWWAVDVAWAIPGGLLIGAAAGTLVGRLVVHLRKTHRAAVGRDELLALGLLALAYGLALLAHTYGFLAAFAAGVALRRVEAQCTGGDAPPDVTLAAEAAPPDKQLDAATHPETAPAYMAHAVLGVSERLERLTEVGVVLLLGGMLTAAYLPRDAIWFVPLLLLVIRPAAVLLGLAGTSAAGLQRGLTCWFGIRGVGSVYYLAYAIQHGLSGDVARLLTGLTLTTVAVSVVVHGVSVTPLMKLYERVTTRGERRRDEAEADDPDVEPALHGP